MRKYRGTAATKRQARVILLQERGSLPLPCDDCGVAITKFGNDAGHVHHIDHDELNNVTENLALLDANCHRIRHNNSLVTHDRRSQSSKERGAGYLLQTSEIFAKRSATMKVRYQKDSSHLDRMNALLQKARQDPEFVAQHTAALQASWDGNKKRKQITSQRVKKQLSDGTILKKPCPFGCPLVTFPGPMGRHIKAKHSS